MVQGGKKQHKEKTLGDIGYEGCSVIHLAWAKYSVQTVGEAASRERRHLVSIHNTIACAGLPFGHLFSNTLNIQHNRAAVDGERHPYINADTGGAIADLLVGL